MLKKIFGITALIAMVGALVYGAINRTWVKTGQDSAPAGQGGYRRTSENQGVSVEAGGEFYPQGQGGGGRGQGAGGGGGQQGRGQGAGGGQQRGGGYQINLPPAASGELSSDEAAALVYMREEEILARDVYRALYDQWGLPIFQNISQSEQTHSDSIKTLLDRYGLSDPASGEAGVFTNSELQALYTQLVARGSQSLAEALKVGAEIEEIDILDLQTDLAKTDKADIQWAFNNLLNGSANHLRSFVSMLNTQSGETYQPQHLSAEAYQSMLSSGGGRGNGGGWRGGNRL